MHHIIGIKCRVKARAERACEVADACLFAPRQAMGINNIDDIPTPEGSSIIADVSDSEADVTSHAKGSPAMDRVPREEPSEWGQNAVESAEIDSSSRFVLPPHGLAAAA